jgi:opacity protein-like surface antigen
MKKIILTVFALGAFTFSNAQSREKGTIELVPQIGYSSANFYGEEELDTDELSAATFGVGADYFFNDRWSIHSGLFSQKMGAEAGGADFKINYLTIPAHANWHFGSTRKWYLNFGPSFSFLTDAKLGSVDVKDGINSFQLGLGYGIGYKIEVSEKFSISIDFQGISGLTETFKENDGFTVKNSFGAFNVGGVIKL